MPMEMTVVCLAPISVRHCLLDFFKKTKMFSGALILRNTKNEVLFFRLCFFKETMFEHILKRHILHLSHIILMLNIWHLALQIPIER